MFGSITSYHAGENLYKLNGVIGYLASGL